MTQTAHIITGPTAVGKTAYAISLAKKIGGTIICLDSRQFFQKVDALVGKDLPPGEKSTLGQITLQNTKIDLSSHLDPKDNLRYFLFDSVPVRSTINSSLVNEMIFHLLKLLPVDKIPIFVGGTWLYVKNLISPPPTLDLPQNKQLRKDLQSKDLSQLQNLLKKNHPKIFESLNASDLNNPRRLIRRLEVGEIDSKLLPISPLSNFDIELTALLPEYNELEYKEKIKIRLLERFDKSTEEIRELLKINVSVNSQIMTSIGAKLILEFLDKNLPKDELLDIWTNKEYQYTRRQLTFMKKDIPLISKITKTII